MTTLLGAVFPLEGIVLDLDPLNVANRIVLVLYEGSFQV
jgi:hypothetical protein